MKSKLINKRTLFIMITTLMLLGLIGGFIYARFISQERSILVPIKSCVKKKPIFHKFEVGSCIPNLNLLNAAQEKVSSDQADGKPTLLYFWSSNCDTCKKELTFLNRKYKEQHQQIHFLIIHSLSFEPNATLAKKWFQQQHFSFPYLVNKFQTVSHPTIVGLPTTFILDQQNVIQHKMNGPFNRQQMGQLLQTIIQDKKTLPTKHP
ncbi:Thiol-disulfide isomerase or thioredoxin [Seinonella peptonophila]|uniref:Thiol-disulfide isomerase or thioredoxin n=1 Tax=Seinonella peptonophila TaxID=112248 RepID=A0A1M4SR40_9BACL|nr:TlpA family protein disulfide reductase [Seinonella peptonophila]SHE34437.1 Thiol-disulfide isomerase or thioredoxin [Seinonella peptonophila]